MTTFPTHGQPTGASEPTPEGHHARHDVSGALRGDAAWEPFDVWPGAVVGPRASVIRHMRGERVTVNEFATDHSEWGIWTDTGTLQHRPPELWVDQIRDAGWSDQ